MAPAGTALCFVLLGSKSPEKQPTPSLPAPADITGAVGRVCVPPTAPLYSLASPNLGWPVVSRPPHPGPEGGRVRVDALGQSLVSPGEGQMKRPECGDS